MNYDMINKTAQNCFDDCFHLVNEMYENPELGLEEFHTQKILTDYLEKSGFKVSQSLVCKTDYVAEYKSDKEGPVIGYLCEYDALPEVGHGCGHNMIAGMSIGAAIALKSVIDEIGGTIKVIGTPAEETIGGKVLMSEAGIFNDLDVALLIHPGNDNGVGSRSTAICPTKFEFFGKNAHACEPFEGRSALDGAVMTYVQLNMLRQFVKEGTFIHGIIKDGGTAANVIPAYASLEYYFRAPTMAYAKEVKEKAINIAQGACVSHGLTLKVSEFENPYDDTLINYTLASLMKEKFNVLGINDVKDVDEKPGGSTDVGSVSYVCPTIQGGIKIAGKEVLGHSKEFADAIISPLGKEQLLNGMKVLAYMGYDLITDQELLKKVKDEFNKR